MAAMWKKLSDWIRGLFWKQEMEITLVGLQSAGKTTLLTAISDGKLKAERDTIPTIGLNTRKVTKGSVSIKLWDIGGQPRFRAMWERYCRGVNAIVYVVDAADQANFDQARTCLHDLLSKPALASTPLLVLANKNDLPGALSEKQIASVLELTEVHDREVTVYSISAKNYVNIDVTMNWLIQRAGKKGAQK
jgi:ADP-ribosylation factor-like protein 8